MKIWYFLVKNEAHRFRIVREAGRDALSAMRRAVATRTLTRDDTVIDWVDDVTEWQARVA